MEKKNEMTPEDKLMKAVYGDDWKTDAEIEEEIKDIGDDECAFSHDRMMLFIHAMERRDELKDMVESIMENKYFPNENYRNVFEWALMEAAQWQYEEIMRDMPKWKPAARSYLVDKLPRVDHLLNRVVAKIDDSVYFLAMDDLYKLPKEE